MACVSGTTRFADGWVTQYAVEKRTVGAPTDGYAMVAALVMGGMIAGYYLWPPDPSIGALTGGFLGVVAQYPAYRWLRLRAWRKTLDAQYAGLDLPVMAEVAPDALTFEIGDVRRIHRWCCVSDLFWNRGYWIFLAQSRPVLIPQKLFADETAERAFLSEALSYMSDTARARSPDAVKFVGKSE